MQLITTSPSCDKVLNQQSQQNWKGGDDVVKDTGKVGHVTVFYTLEDIFWL